MNTVDMKQPEIVIDLKEVMWELLSRWKIILIIGILMALLVAGLMYYRADQQYQAAMKEKEEAKARSSQSVEERIAGVIEAYNLTEEEQKVVMYLLQQQEMAKTQEEYLDGSVWLNLEPSNQRTLTLTYYLKGEEGIDLQALADSYNVFLHRKVFMKEIQAIIAPEVELKYIYELVNAWAGNIADSDATGVDYTVNIVLPKDADAAAVEEIVAKALRASRADLSKTIGSHTIHLMNKEDVEKYDSGAVDRRLAVTNNINNLQNNIQNFRTTLTDDQRSALNAITAIYNGSEGDQIAFGEDVAVEAEDSAPGFRGKFLLTGFLLGVFLYAGVYVLLLILRRRMTAEELRAYTHARLLGEIHLDQPSTGLDRMIHSRLVDRFRYRNRNDLQKELKETADRIEAVCAHEGVEELHFLQALDPAGEGARTIAQLAEQLEQDGLHVETLFLDKDIEEKSVLPVKQAVIFADQDSRADFVWNFTQLCAQFEVRSLGCVYLNRQ